MKHIFAMIMTLVISTQSFADETARPKASEKPHAMMQALSVLNGQWSMTSEYSEDNGKTWQKSPATPVSIETRHKGLMMAETPDDTSAPGFHLETYITYDQYREHYRMAVIDDVWGIMDVYEGHVQDGALVLTNLRSDTSFPMGGGIYRNFRLKFELGEGKRMLIIDKTDDKGNSWHPNFRVTYVKTG